MIPPAILNETVAIRRRTSTGRDALNNPTYGTPTSGTGWNTVYQNMPVRLAFKSKDIRFAPDGERIQPTGVMYYNTTYTLKQEDRVVTSDGIEYTVTGLSLGSMVGSAASHYEATVALP